MLWHTRRRRLEQRAAFSVTNTGKFTLHIWSKKGNINPLITKRIQLYLKIQFVPRSKRFSPRL